MIQQLLAISEIVATWLWGVANSNFTTALAGAGAGAYCAQWIIARNQSKERLIKEIRSTNAAIMITFGITNTTLGLKNQHVNKLKEMFDGQKNDLKQFVERNRKGEIVNNKRFEFQADFKSLSLPPAPLRVLQDLVFSEISALGRPISLVATLSQCLETLAEAIARRNDIIAYCKANPPSHDELAALYFGLPDQRGRTDQTYADCIDAIVSYTDDCIFFSSKLIEDLVHHGQALADEFGKGAPKIHKPEFSKAEKANLMPSDEQYADWLAAFKGVNPATK